MKLVVSALVVLTLLPTPGVRAQDQPTAEGMAAMMEKAKEFTQPGPHHELLTRFLGDWDVEVRITMGGTDSPPEKGTATFSWLLEGRWIQQEMTGSLMGMPYSSRAMFGYDNFKQSYVISSVSTMDTAMHYAEGDLDAHGSTLIVYGTVDEYLTGEHDKMVKTVWRLLSDDEMIMEVHDLPIGEENTQVVEVRYARKS